MDPYWQRQEELGENKLLKEAGAIFYFYSAVYVILIVVAFVLMSQRPIEPSEGLGALVGIVVCAALSALCFFVGRAIRQRRPWGRTVGILLAVLSLVGIPLLGTLLGIYAIYALAKTTSEGEFA